MTKPTTVSQIKRAWHLVDLKDKNLGRTATDIAKLLMGKNKPYFARNLDCGDYVVVINAKEVAVTGNKEGQKRYYRYSGYPGGLHVETLSETRTKHPERIIEHAVKGMLPQNKLRDRMLTRLKIFTDSTHPYQDKFSTSRKETVTTSVQSA